MNGLLKSAPVTGIKTSCDGLTAASRVATKVGLGVALELVRWIVIVVTGVAVGSLSPEGWVGVLVELIAQGLVGLVVKLND